MSRSSPQVEQPEDDEPRRGSRARKAVERFAPGGSRVNNASGDDSDDDQNMEDEDEEEEPRPKGGKRKSTGGKAATNGTAPARKRKTKPTPHDAAPVEVVQTDCPLYNALLSPDIALLPLIEDWVETYQHTTNDETSEKASVHELVLFFIRCCGLSASLTEDEAMDIDGIVDTLENIQDESLQTSLAIYPLIAKTKEARIFRNNLSLFIPHLIKTLSLTPLLYQTAENTSHIAPIIPLILNWLHSMSSSPLRPLRHTSTHLVLKINSALCDVAASVSSELSLRQRQKDAEAKKGGAGPAAQKKLKELEEKVKESRGKKTRLEEYLTETFDVMFVHRVRDADPAIRTDCLKELGVWVKKYGEIYISTAYLNYFTRGCNDPDSKARLETVKALPSLFGTDNSISRARTVILRLAPRVIEMALRDIDINVRIHAIHIITEIDKTGTLEDEDEDQRVLVARLVFDHEPKVRKAVGGFFRGLWEQRLERLRSEWTGSKGNKKKRAGKVTDEEMEVRLAYKALAGLLVDTAKSLDKGDDPSSSKQPSSISASTQAINRANAAVGALWDDFDGLQSWENLAEYLLLDHSDSDDMWLLKEGEEDLLLQVLVACIKRDDREDGEEKNEQTQTLMNVLPRLFTKHQADSERMTSLLSIPVQMKLSLYLDMRKTAAYTALWDDVTKQFLQHSEPNLLTSAIRTINHLTANTAMSTVNSTKEVDLDETVFTTLRDAINGEDVFSMSMDEDRLAAVQTILLRISLLCRSKDQTEIMEDEEGGQSSGWDIVCAFAERGEVGYKEESKLVEYALQILFLHITWLFKRFTPEDAENESKVEALKARAARAKAIYYKLALRERTNAAEVVRRQAFISFLNLHLLFSAKSPTALPAAKACSLELADEMQHRLGGAFGAAAERYASDLEELAEDQDDDPSSFSLDRAQHELVFIQLVSVFVGAIRCGVLEVDHAREPLAHYGRFGLTYDAVVKKLVDVLRDEGIYNKQADTVQNVVGTALQNSFNMFLDAERDEEPAATTALAKLIATSFVVQGTHFTVLRQIHPSDVTDLHLSAIDYISRKISTLVKQEVAAKSKSAKDRVNTKLAHTLAFFKTLIHLLGPISSADALRIRDHMDQCLSGTGVKLGNGKAWDGYRGYEKRLLAIASRDPKVKVVVKKKVVSTEEVETEAEEEEEVEDDRATPTPATVPAKRMREEPEGAQDERNGHADDSLELPALELGDEEGMDFELNMELDMPGSQERERSLSVEPVLKRRKTVKRY